MLMMLPPRARAIMRGATARVPCRTVFKFARTRASQPFSLVSRKAARNVPPTSLTSTSMPPKRSTVATTACSTASASRTSAGSARACPPARSISAAVERAVAASSSRTATRAPNAARPRAIPFPMPAPAPVTTAVRPVRDACCGSIALLRRVADEHALAALEAVAELVGEVRPARGVLAGVLVHQALLDGGVVDDLAARIERWPVGLADRDARLRAPLLDAPHAPGGGRRADVDRLAVVVEPARRRLPARRRGRERGRDRGAGLLRAPAPHRELAREHAAGGRPQGRVLCPDARRLRERRRGGGRRAGAGHLRALDDREDRARHGRDREGRRCRARAQHHQRRRPRGGRAPSAAPAAAHPARARRGRGAQEEARRDAALRP